MRLEATNRILICLVLFFELSVLGLATPVATRSLHQPLDPSSRSPGTHFLDSEYKFSREDGWQQLLVRGLLNTTAPRQTGNHVIDARSKSSKKPSDDSWNNTLGVISHALGDAMKVIITWYTGHDLENPSCWAKDVWTPTDDSYACALTLEGWKDRPKCFDFLELCNGNKCVFVRVVDTCAGCAAGSKHVDLTKSAFASLTPLDTGITTVQMRKATQPKDWDTKLYGPKA